jgi:molecular chaperone HtpG
MSLPTDAGITLGELDLIKKLQERNSPILKKIEDVFENVRHCLNTRIPMVFPNYTMHDIGHSLRIIKYMGELVNNVNELSDLEIALLILAALLHDVGMAAGQEEIDLIKAEKLPEADIRYAAMLKYMGGNDVLALQEFVRRIHGKLSARYVLHEDVIQHCFTIPELPSLSFARELAVICQSHTENYDYIKKYLLINDSKGEYHYNGQYIATILRLADILDIDSNRT